MYSGYGFRDFEIGDVDVVKHEGLYHLFHLTLPNHDYIAHAVSEDGLRWQRVENALFVGDPKAWDDDMLWTMHVTPDPVRQGEWRMFYTGLCMRERGRIQRVGVARSRDLYRWVKDSSGRYPLSIPGSFYENDVNQGRKWISFRDPFWFSDNGENFLIAAARVNMGPVIRRGCVALARESEPDTFEFLAPLFHPMRYDDLEVPNLLHLFGRYFLIASIREDIKVHYWHADELQGPYRNFHDNVLLPQGNYAARIAFDGEKWLVWNFFFRGLTTRGHHLMAPPKELELAANGELVLKSFSGFEKLVSRVYRAADLEPLEPLFKNPHAGRYVEDAESWFGCDSGIEAFVVAGVHKDLILTGKMHVKGNGKTGLTFRVNEQGDGYYLSVDFRKGIAQIRAWGQRPGGTFEEAYQYEQLQAGYYVATPGPYPFKLIVYEEYIEFSLNGYVLLTLADEHFDEGRVGFYVESASMRIEDLELKECGKPTSTSYPEHVPNF